MKNFSSELVKQDAITNSISNIADDISNLSLNNPENIYDLASDVLYAGKSFFGENNTKTVSEKLADGMIGWSIDDRFHYLNISLNQWIYETNLFKSHTHYTNVFDDQIFFQSRGNEMVKYEDPFKIGSTVASVINNYKYSFKHTVPQQLEPVAYTSNVGGYMTIVQSVNAPSLFNPYASINVIGITENIPLVHNSVPDNTQPTYDYDNLDDENLTSANQDGEPVGDIHLQSGAGSMDKDISDCSITALVAESKKERGGCLGLATYRYVDFMYCKDLGKIPNNRLITLRRFPTAINDNIFSSAHPKSGDKKLNPAKSIQDMGRLITWFDNDDNKLEDICRYQYHATWKQFEAKIDQQESVQSDDGPLDKIANFLSPQNNLLVGRGFSGNTGLLKWGLGKLNVFHLPMDRMDKPYYNMSLLKNYDQNRIYEPPNRVWDTHKYEGRLVFNQDITLTFRYTLRSYENINPKTAFLDLIGNIQIVTYRSGSFWGGQNSVVGPSGNTSVYNKANAWIDKAFDKLGGFWSSLASGDFDISGIQEWINNAIETAQQFLGQAKETAAKAIGAEGQQGQEEVKQEAKDKLQEAMGKVAEYNKRFHWTDALKGMLKNQLGRPAMYAFNSLLTGEAVGPWHLTIGNPKNPILVMGNLIMENAETQHLGPLGLDDFPTEIKVTVQLKHGKPRDSIDIQKMYTKGVSSIYKSMKFVKTQNYWYNENAFGDLKDIFSESPMLLRKGLSSI